MKKINILSILTLLILLLFASCDNTGVFDSIWNDEKVSNENISIVVGRTSDDNDTIYYLSEVNGLSKFANNTITVLNTDSEFKASRIAAFDSTGTYIISYNDISKKYTVASLVDGNILFTTNTVENLGEISKGSGYLFYCKEGTYTLNVNVENESITANSTPTGAITGNMLVISDSGIYEMENNVYFTSPVSTGINTSYIQASFGEESDPGVFVASTSDHKYLFFYKDNRLNLYAWTNGSSYSKVGEGISTTYFTSDHFVPKAVLTSDSSSIVLIRGNQAILVDPTTGAQRGNATSLSYDYIKGLFGNNDGTFTVVTFNNGIHTLTVSGTTIRIQ